MQGRSLIGSQLAEHRLPRLLMPEVPRLEQARRTQCINSLQG